MRKTVIIIISAAAVCIIAACVLFLTGVLHFPGKTQEAQTTSPEFCVEYMNAYMLVDKSGTVTGSSAEKPEGVPEISGISFSKIVVGEDLIPTEENEFDYAKKVEESLKRNDIIADEIYISSDMEASVYLGNVRVLLGKDDKTEEKLRELREFYEDLKDLSGVLDMQELSRNNMGYSLKPDKKENKKK